jgi:5-methyltetrahydrofolate--homocysteine methyltransferase
MSQRQELIEAINDMQEEEALQIAQNMLDQDEDPVDILEACREAMEIIGKRFEEGDCFVPELIMAGEVLTQITDMVKPKFAGEIQVEKQGKIVIGTVEGDIHDIAKDIVVFMLDTNGFEVTDLGVDVPPARFVEATKETGASMVGLSGFLTLAYDPMKETVEALKAAGLDHVKVMIGGGQIDEQVKQYTGADAFGRDAMTAVSLAKQWAG